MWGAVQVARRQILARKLAHAFKSCGLKNGLGNLPGYVFDRAVDEHTRRLRLSNAGFSKKDFLEAQARLQTVLRVYIDGVKEDIRSGTVDIVYSHHPMPTLVRIPDVKSLPSCAFVVGNTRARQIMANLRSVPHLLVAGQTGGGKSTFLGQLIAALYVNDSTSHFTLIDLKGGMEFGLFSGLKRVRVADNIKDAIGELSLFDTLLEQRMQRFKEHHCKELDQFVALTKKNPSLVQGIERENLCTRRIIVMDEAAELFLVGGDTQARDVQAAKRVLSKIARQGRSVGIHLVVATQRPDAKSLDPQVKANLTGVLCFQTVNDASSISILGNGRATDLPAIPGRAIWKCGAEQKEVQTPYLTTDEICEVLKLRGGT
jgi:DNA segregation ATPase FtsK/SpoIIIE, S-DNA-T family